MLKDGETKNDAHYLQNWLFPNQKPSYCLGETLEKQTKPKQGVS